MREKTAEQAERARQLEADGYSRTDIAVRLGVSRAYVTILLGAKKSGDKTPRTVDVPAWVPAAMHEEYRVVAETEDEFAAASWARKAKRERGL